MTYVHVETKLDLPGNGLQTQIEKAETKTFINSDHFLRTYSLCRRYCFALV